MTTMHFITLFHIDELALVMMTLVLFIGLCVGSFAYRYLQGDKEFRIFFIQFILLIGFILVMVCADHLVLLFGAWCLCNILLVRLMIYKRGWKAAKASGLLTAKNYGLGAMCVAGAFALFYVVSGKTSIQGLLHQHSQSRLLPLAMILMLIGAMTQSAIWPFHRWLISSLNSPTPVSAVMHAGLVNGGGFLLARFSPLYCEHSYLLSVIFVIGMVSALLGSLWKLIQSDVKRMLACSTMGQMGFMLAQCGLGLFPAAVAHLALHGMFKAYLFLASGSAAQEKRFDPGYRPTLVTFSCMLMCGIVASLAFGLVSGKSWFSGDTTLILMVIAFFTGSQFAFPLLQHKTPRNLLLALLVSVLLGLVYGSSVQLITLALNPMHLMQPQALNGFYLMGVVALTLAWLSMLFVRRYGQRDRFQARMLKSYVLALNASQPHPETVTSHRNQYHCG